jgi:hypothetical protein
MVERSTDGPARTPRGSGVGRAMVSRRRAFVVTAAGAVLAACGGKHAREAASSKIKMPC